MEPAEYASIAELEATHWWYEGMRRITSAILRDAKIQSDAAILDAGCGPGGTSAFLGQYGRVVGVDAAREAIAFSRVRIPVVRGSVTALPFGDASFDLVTSFDVLYHSAVESDVAAAREAYRVLRPRGAFLLRVPAFEFLRAHHDVVVHTRRRYRADEIRCVVEAAGFRVEKVTHANGLLFPIAAIKRTIEKLGPGRLPKSDVSETPGPLNAVLTAILSLEARIIRRRSLPFGVSIFCLARK